MLCFFTGAIDHAPQIILRAFTGAGAIAPISWQALFAALSPRFEILNSNKPILKNNY
jgi:hypothetical protein